MPNFASSELGRAGIEALAGGRIDLLTKRLSAASDGAPPDDAQLKKVAQDFAAVFYSMAFKEMQQSAHLFGSEQGEDGGDEDDQGPVSQGSQDFVGMFLPKAIAGDAGDPVARYIYDSLKQHYGEALDEKA